MMITTIAFICLLVGFFILILYFFLKSDRAFNQKHLIILSTIAVACLVVFLHAGTDKIKSDIFRIFNNSKPKSAEEIYIVLFGKPPDTCVRIINLEDQLVPQIDCCVWMEIRMCPAEVRRISSVKNYTTQLYLRADSIPFLQNFPDRPEWWKPQMLSETIIALHFKRSDRNQQYIFLNYDSTRVFVCDIAI